jgi:two-component system, chemotaxis family, protein-glutamate methylesterase/glutaminase
MIKVLIVDDQSVVRNILEESLQQYSFITVVGKASNALEAKQMVPILKPDVITLDVEMPKMNGLEFLDWLMPNFPTPVLMLSSFTEVGEEITLEALDRGAMDFILKPDGTESDFVRMLNELVGKIKKLGNSNNITGKNVLYKKKETIRKSVIPKTIYRKIQLVVIGASTGGTRALELILNALPTGLPPIVVVQHITENFTKRYADRLGTICDLQVKEAENGELLEDGYVYIAPGNHHLLVRKMAGKLLLETDFFDKVSGHRPSIDVLFESVARGGFASTTLGVLLTGMGKDGAAGLLSLRKNGARTIGQDEASSVVYGMPKEAFLLGAVEKQMSLEDIAEGMVKIMDNG